MGRLQPTTAAGAAVLLAAAAGIGLVYYEGRTYDAEVARLIERAKAEGFDVSYVESERTFLGRTFRLGLTEAGESLYWTGNTRFGWGVKSRLALDQTEGLGTLLAKAGVRGFEDELVLSWSPFGSLRPVTWRGSAFAWHDESFGTTWSFGEQTISVSPAGDGAYPTIAYAFEGVRVKDTDVLEGAEERKVWTELGPVRLDYRGLADEGADMTLTIERAAVTDDFSAGKTTLAYRLERVKDKASTSEGQTGGGVLDTVESEPNYTENVMLTVEKPVVNGVANDRFSVRARLTGLTAGMIEEFAAIGTGVFLGGLTEQQLFTALGAVQNAFVTGGLVWELDECVLTRGDAAASLTGHLAYEAPDATTSGASPRLGAFQMSIPETFVHPDAVAAPLAQGAVKLVDGNLVSHFEIFADRITANGVLLESF